MRGPSAPHGAAKGMRKINRGSILPQLVLLQGDGAVQRAIQACPIAQCCQPQTEPGEQGAAFLIPQKNPLYPVGRGSCSQLFPK